MSRVIHSWSGPRSLSTSLMYSWGNRADCAVLDEPLYAHWLRLTNQARPYREQVLQSMPQDGDKVITDMLSAPPDGKKYLYAKHIAKQRLGLEKWPALLKEQHTHFILIRNPSEILTSFNSVVDVTLNESSYPTLCEIFSDLRTAYGKPPIIVDSFDIRKLKPCYAQDPRATALLPTLTDCLRNPEGMLRSLCAHLEVPFDPHMLKWEAGPKPFDGVWAPWWYKNTHNSFTFAPPSTPKPLLPELHHVYEECLPLYTMLARHKLTPETPVRTSVSVTNVGTKAPGDPAQKKKGTHVYDEDARNEDVLVGMRDGMTGGFSLVRKGDAKVSVLDSAFMLGDGIWEGIRLHGGVLVRVKEHMDRLFENAKALDMDLGLSQRELVDMLYKACDANGMQDDVHIRLMVSRGLKPTPYQDPYTTLGMPLIVILPEHKKASEAPKTKGITLFTVHVQRGPPNVQDQMWNSHSKLNCISACIQAKKAGADEGLMLDPNGFVATCNSVNFFVVRKGVLWAPTRKYQLHGITRQKTLDLAAEAGIPTQELDFSLTEVYSADECFTTGTFAGQIPVVEVDGRCIGNGKRGPITQRLQELYKDAVMKEAAQGRRLETFPTEKPLYRRPKSE